MPSNAHEMIVVPGDPNCPRNSEADIVLRADGSLLLGWSEFYASEGEDWSPCRLAGKTSDDGGITWSKPFRILENEARQSTMEVDFLRAPSGDLLLFYLKKNGDDDCRVMMQRSDDDGTTWSDPQQVSDWHGYVATTNARSFVTSTGRIILPIWYCILNSSYTPNYAVCQALYSDDDGDTWNLSRPPLGAADSPGGSAEPAAVELYDGRILMMMRNGSGRIWQSVSGDRGETWEPPTPTDLATSTSPICLTRIPNTSDILVIWNQASQNEIEWGLTRSRLSCAISSDDCRTWRHFKNLESHDNNVRVEPTPVGTTPDTGRGFWQAPLPAPGPLNCSYPSCTFVGDNVVITYDVPAQFCALKLRVLPIGWFYDDNAPSFRTLGSGSVESATYMPRATGT